MCNVCGCGEGETIVEEHTHHHSHDDHVHDHHDHDHGHIDLGTGAAGLHVAGMSQSRLIALEQDILGKNQVYADANREVLRGRGQLALNLVSSPGSGKTSLLCRTLGAWRHSAIGLGVIEGDQQTTSDAQRIRRTGAPAIQINTGKGCHLDGHAVGHALENLDLPPNSVLFIENVGNLVCPAAFDLGEDFRVAILSVTEGTDKPIKYPDIFASADLVLLNKIDLLPHLDSEDFDLEACRGHIASVAPQAGILLLSAKTGEGLTAWLAWLLEQARRKSLASIAG